MECAFNRVKAIVYHKIIAFLQQHIPKITMNKFLTLLFFAVIGNHLIAQDFNLSFENMDTSGLPSNWFIQYPFAKTALVDDAHQGKRAIRISNTYSYFSGNLFSGNIAQQKTSTLTEIGQQGSFGLPIHQKVKSLKGWYKYEQIQQSRLAIDSGQVIVFLRRFIASEQKSIMVGQGLLNLGKAEQFTEFTVPIHNLKDLTPDTISIFITTSSGYRALNPEGGIKRLSFNNPSACGNEFGNTCLYLTIDDLSLQLTTPIKNLRTNVQPLQISPNPAQDQTIINWDVPDRAKTFDVNITDALGRTVLSIQTARNQAEINTGDLPKGVYLVYLRQGAQLIGVERLVVAK